jgi:penicillin-binding protein 2
MHFRSTRHLLTFLLAVGLMTAPMFGATPHSKRRSVHRTIAARTGAKTRTARTAARTRSAWYAPSGRAHFTAVALGAHRPSSHLSRLALRRHAAFSPWTEPTFADSTAGDLVDGEDLVVRRAAVQALGPFNGTIVVTDPQSGRILSIVNQKLAYKSGFQPCSTIKLVAALAGLNEGIIDQESLLQTGAPHHLNLTEAIARSDNSFFANVGTKLGFERVTRYAKLFGLGEKASTIDEELPGKWPLEPPSEGGVGMMTSFGLGITLTPLELADLVSAIANGGTLYTLQHPRTLDEIAQFVPRVKRHLEVASLIPNIKPGMMGAVEFGTARRATFDPNAPIFGKTGTCTDKNSPTHLGWFGSFNEVGSKKIVVVVLLTGGGKISGPVASGVAGSVYKNLAQEDYFGQGNGPLSLISTTCCH